MGSELSNDNLSDCEIRLQQGPFGKLNELKKCATKKRSRKPVTKMERSATFDGFPDALRESNTRFEYRLLRVALIVATQRIRKEIIKKN